MKNNINFTFLILHYISIDDTIGCVNSIKKNCENYNIVIVDNASPNNSFKELKKIFANDSHIHLIKNATNLGFAKGNNVGFSYAKQKLQAQYIAMINNDTEILCKNFINRVIQDHQQTSAAVIGPRISLANGQYDSLYSQQLPTSKYIKRDIRKKKMLLLLNYLNLESTIRKLLGKTSTSFKRSNLDTLTEHHDIILHGCCLIFTPEYISKFDGLDEKTFMYVEEELLAIKLRKNSLHSLYDPKLHILHKEYGSTKKSTKNQKTKNRFTYKQLIIADKVLLKEIREIEKQNKSNAIGEDTK